VVRYRLRCGHEDKAFTRREYEDHWAEKLKKRIVGDIEDNANIVGVQWNASAVGRPPDSWDDSVTYRPVFQECLRLVHGAGDE